MNRLVLCVSCIVVIVALVIFVYSTVTLRFHKPERRRTWMAGILLVSGALGIYTSIQRIASSPPGDGQVVDIAKPNDSRKPVKRTPVERLLQAWSAADDMWPAAPVTASLSLASYSPPIELEDALMGLGFQRSKTIVHSSILGYVLSGGETSVIVFRGTDDTPDWFANLEVASAAMPHGKVHRGFSLAYDSLKPQILSILRKEKPKHIWITGHSLGGAIAGLCAYDFVANQLFTIDGLMTFGQPMFADHQLASYLDGQLPGKYIRFVNESDIVPRAPPVYYAHCGTWIWFKGGNVKRARQNVLYGGKSDTPPSNVETPPPPLSLQEFEAKKAQLRARTPQDKNGVPVMEAAPRIIQDHSMNRYLVEIMKLEALSD